MKWSNWFAGLFGGARFDASDIMLMRDSQPNAALMNANFEELALALGYKIQFPYKFFSGTPYSQSAMDANFKCLIDAAKRGKP